MAIVTLKDIANSTGYSFSLVSRVLRNTGIDNIPEKTINKIRDTAHEMGYIVNKNAKSLKMNRTNIIAVVMPVGVGFQNTIFPMLTESIVAAQNQYDCEMDFVFFNTDGGYKEYENLQEIVSLNPEGIIYSVPPKGKHGLSSDIKRQQLLHDLAADGKPIIFLMEKYDIPGTCTYSFDDEQGVYCAIKFLIEKGCKDILYMKTPFENRTAGYMRAAEEFGCRINITAEDIGFSYQNGYDFFENLYGENAGKKMPDAIFATCDLCAMGIRKAMHERNIADEEIMLMGFDCLDTSYICDYSFYSVKQPVHDMGRECTQAILQWIETGEKPENKLYKPEIIEFPPLKK